MLASISNCSQLNKAKDISLASQRNETREIYLLKEQKEKDANSH